MVINAKNKSIEENLNIKTYSKIEKKDPGEIKIIYLLDENIRKALKSQLILHVPLIDIIRVGEEGAPPLGSIDQDILNSIQNNNRILVTGDRSSMPTHFGNHLEKGQHAKVFVVRRNTHIGDLIKILLCIWCKFKPADFNDTIIWLPVRANDNNNVLPKKCKKNDCPAASLFVQLK
ncbi:MAG: DUF5615 family PIN-like protein [Candidatus Aminicenantes bacterium]|nr:DUF5615 family PIN-like protein [Candidatus Aminicenantes bacterium]